ncbi:unnamed protein product [Rotaria magnacalcarata]|uniref:N-acetyltransferase domain-containing protein n=1 Tax=Rotaria magnacalcarata TaxID=392030 RepID=A0A815DRP3_9BILA|nr:unnamed protein product [Rotaria magnacalcarata]CAF4401804.1 unnamed protein product [Rotaria magnacalcarata]
MMNTHYLPDEEIDGRNSINMNETPSKTSPRSKQSRQPANSNGVTENGNGSLSESIPSKQPKQFEKILVNDSTLEASMQSSLNYSNSNSNAAMNPSESPFAPVQSSLSTESTIDPRPKYQQIELTTVTDDDDYDDIDKNPRKSQQSKDTRTFDHDAFVASVTTLSESDVIEIHEFSLADIDAYLDIYFEVLHNRLAHFIGDDDQIQRFRTAMNGRINNDSNAREYRNVLLGKINGEVVAAVTLSFPEETTTISNDDILPQVDSCIKSMRRWMVRNANYIPKNTNECYIEMIGVKNSYRNHGIGAALLECVEHFARQAGALLLTVHTNGEQLRNYFTRFGFMIDRSDNSAFWKWTVERQSINKMAKLISPDSGDNYDNVDNTGSYVNGSIAESELE